jgi:hypothetical protein
MRMPSILASTIFAAATVLGSTAAFAGPFGSGGQIKTTENSYESTVANPGDILNGIFNVAQINGSSGITYSYGTGTFLTGTFTGFVLDTVNPISGGFRLSFTGGALQYYSSASDPFAGARLVNNTQLAPTLANQAAAIADLATGTLELSLTPQLIDATHTLYIDVFGGVPPFTTFVSAGTSNVFLDITGGASASLFATDSITNTFTLALADAVFLGTANTQNCSIASEWQVCGQNSDTLNVIPEPFTLSVFGAGLVGAAALRRRKAKKA